MSLDPGLFIFAASSLAIAAVAMLIDRLLGYPNGLQDRVGHPVEWIGSMIAAQDAALNKGESRRMKGVIALTVIVALVLAVTVPLTLWLRGLESGWIAEALLASALLSQKSLDDHVYAVAAGLRKSLAAGRDAVRHIVGRDPARLERSGVVKGAIESLAENMSDGVTAPLFWLVLAGLPGIALYKAVNTADSMIGHKSERYSEFGRASARLDDLLNLVPSRVTGWLIAVAAAILPGVSGKDSIGAMARDARNHSSPNAGWPEASMAGALGIRLGGPRSYGGKRVELPFMGNGRAKLDTGDIDRALRVYNTALNILTGLLVAACFVRAAHPWMEPF